MLRRMTSRILHGVLPSFLPSFQQSALQQHIRADETSNDISSVSPLQFLGVWTPWILETSLTSSYSLLCGSSCFVLLGWLCSFDWTVFYLYVERAGRNRAYIYTGSQVKGRGSGSCGEFSAE
ncbi:hypothetical protein RvY_13079 [Ramazzottius varieornatus]|uniref:Uncharacterized protein n=1 Tax=Ramazzottius varieornatus TaxID=947166 RepID=A0A1D1VU91_RAMVA|nr:hypothetical protein RvY_13079 [Ramazzottius varieornatus]